MRHIDLAKKRGKQSWYDYEGVWHRAFVRDGRIVVESTGISHDVPYWRAVKQYVRIQSAPRSGT